MKKRRRKKKRRKQVAHKQEAQRIRTRRRRKIAEASRRAVVAPSTFSFIEDPEGFILFLHEIESTCADGNNVFIELSGIQSMTPDSVAVLLSKLRDESFVNEMHYSGSRPDDPELERMMVDSGFFDHVETRGRRSSQRGVGEIFEKESYQVESEKANELLERTNKVVPGEINFHWDGIQSAIVEAMSNTVDHASRNPSENERWWLSVYCDESENIAYFSFVDNGVGIFESLKRKGLLEKIKQVLRISGRDEILRSVVNGEYGSSTGLGYRGNGLPNIYRKLEYGMLDNLIIISNNVYGNVAADEYRIMNESFSGTFLYWTHRGQENDGN